MTKISLVIFLHFYQPPNQQEDILERIVFESYRPILNFFLENPKARASFSFPAGLAKLLIEKGFGDVVNNLGKLIKRNQIELTGTAAFHAFLPLLPAQEIKRQILLNEKGLDQIFGKNKRTGFFPPELTYSYKLAKIVENLGFSWMVVPMISMGAETPDFQTGYQLKDSNLYLFPRHKWASAVILSGQVRSKKSFLEWLSKEKPAGYWLTIMDGETFGHHRPGLENLLEELIKGQEFETLKVSDLFKKIDKTVEVLPREASWSNEEQDFWLDKERTVVARNPFLLWCDPANPIHKLQWQLTALAIWAVQNYELRIKNYELKKKIQHSAFAIQHSDRLFLKQVGARGRNWLKARKMLDQALASDHYWWASAKPWWSLEMVEAGSWQLVQVVKAATNSESKIIKKAQELYRKILDIAFSWQRTGLIRRKHRQLQGDWIDIPFKVRAPKEWYNQIILEFEDEMRKAAKRREFEKAIKWRDAIYKLQTGADIFDVAHVVNELQVERIIPSLKPFLLHKDSEISKFAKKYLQKLTPDEVQVSKKRLREQGYKI